MTTTIVLTCIAAYLFVGIRMHPKLAMEAYKRESARYHYTKASKMGASAAAAIQSLIWPVMWFLSRSVKYIDNEIELEAAMQKVRKQIEEEKRAARTRATSELRAFDAAMKQETKRISQ